MRIDPQRHGRETPADHRYLLRLSLWRCFLLAERVQALAAARNLRSTQAFSFDGQPLIENLEETLWFRGHVQACWRWGCPCCSRAAGATPPIGRSAVLELELRLARSSVRSRP